jgi:predicted DNA-binding helix-hairpin-helix protein
LPEEYDPKCHWAIKHPEFFPVEINTAPPERLVRVPGIGFKSAYKIVNARRYTKLDFKDLYTMRVVMKRAVHFITCSGKFLGTDNLLAVKNVLLLTGQNQSLTQLSMFSNDEIKSSVLIGEL